MKQEKKILTIKCNEKKFKVKQLQFSLRACCNNTSIFLLNIKSNLFQYSFIRSLYNL